MLNTALFFAGYVSAQYRFLVKPTGDYTAYFADADIYLNWGDILSVLIPTSSALSGAATLALPSSSQPSLETHEGAACPICLSPPTAPRMTKCGHVYCYPCILQYLSTTDGPASAGPAPIPGAPAGASVNSGNALTGPTNRQWKRCPICWDAVYVRDLKAVRWWDPKAVAAQQDRQPAAGSEQVSDVIGHFENGDEPSTSHRAPSTQNPDYLRMRLMERPQITTLALPQSSTWPTSSTSPSDQPLLAQHQAPWHFQPDVMTYCKFMLATPDLLLESLTQDVDELAAEKKLLSSFGSTQGDDTIAYVTLAEKKVSEQMGKVINELDTPAVRSAIGQAKNDLKEHEEAERGQRVRDSENTSRRRRRQIEREAEEHRQLEVAKATETGDLSRVEAAQDDSSTAPMTTPSVESSEGAEAFLTLRAQGQGGSYLPRPKEEANASPAVATSSDEAANTAPPTAPAPKAHQRPRRNLNPPAPSSSSYLFYQAASGQNIYLHPLDIKVLHSQFGAYSRFPRDIAVKVQGAEEGSMNEELQKRCKYLTHLPKGTDVVFIEVDWETMAATATGTSSAEGVVEADEPRLIEEKTLKPYTQVLRARRNKRRDKERKEDRAKLKAEEAEAASRPGGAAAAARHQQQLQASNGRHGHMLSGSYGSEGGRSAVSSHGQATSPTFMESALWGAEREFPIHPGHHGGSGVDDDFPSALALTAASSSSPHMAPTRSPAPAASLAQPSSRTGSKTVWGTVTPKPSFSSTLHASSRGTSGAAGGAWDEDVDDAWLELEEGFVLGTNNSRQVRPGRGLNSQQNSRRTVATTSGPAGKGESVRIAPVEGEARDQKSNATPGAAPAPTPTPSGGGGGGGKKQRKAKLVLTSGGRGTG